MKFQFLSVCSGIEAFSVATEPLGWEPIAFAEIEKFPSAVLAARFPNVPNLGDITKHEEWTINFGPAPGTIRILCGGTPCQSFSQAGDKGSLSDARGNLCLTFCNIADQYDPDFTLWENVPGVLNTTDNAFGCFLGKLSGNGCPILPPGGKWPNAGFVFGPKRTIAFRVLDAQFFGLAQRRRRLFVIAANGPGNLRGCAALFPLTQGLPWNPTESRDTGDANSPISPASPQSGCGPGNTGDGGVIRTFSGSSQTLANCLTAREGKGADSDLTTTVVVHELAKPLTCRPYADGADATPNLVVCFDGRIRGDDGRGYSRPAAESVNISPTLTTNKPPTVAFESPTEGSITDHSGRDPYFAIRRLTPRECERLQGFPDDWTKIKPTTADGPRYKAIGNSMAVNLIRWIAKRIEFAVHEFNE